MGGGVGYVHFLPPPAPETVLELPIMLKFIKGITGEVIPSGFVRHNIVTSKIRLQVKCVV